MKSWLISIVGISFLSLILDILLSNSKHVKYIKSIYCLIMIYTILFPIVSIIKDIKTNGFDKDIFKIDSAFVQKVDFSLDKNQIENYMHSKNIHSFNIILNEKDIIIYLYENVTDNLIVELKEFLKIYSKNILIKVIE